MGHVEAALDSGLWYVVPVEYVRARSMLLFATTATEADL
jgi:hypothetical protein